MRPKTIFSRSLPITLLSSFVALLVLAVTPAAAQPKSRSAEIASYTKQLQMRFIQWDLNRDKVLDSRELAIAFRGPNAKPYDASTDNIPAALKTNFDKTYLKMLARLTPQVAKVGPPINYALANILYRTWSSKTTPNPATYSSYADYQFVLLAGTTGKSSLTKQEYDSWATQYANMIADYQDSTRNLAAAQSKLRGAKKAQDKQKAMAVVAQRQQDVAAATAALQTIPTIIQQKLAVKR